MTPVATQVSITTIIPMLTAIANRQWEQFKELEAEKIDAARSEELASFPREDI